MRTRHVVLAAAVAGMLGVAASLAVDPGGFGRSRLARLVVPDDLPETGATAGVPDVELTDLAGSKRRLGAVLAGRPTLINFWASWCRPCLEEMPALDAFSRRQGPNGVQVVGIALDDAAAVRAFLQRRPVGYAILLDVAGPADTSVRLGNARGVLPYSVLVDADGRVLRRRVGPLTADDLDTWADAARTRD